VAMRDDVTDGANIFMRVQATVGEQSKSIASLRMKNNDIVILLY
jgi:hypothetical protein